MLRATNSKRFSWFSLVFLVFLLTTLSMLMSATVQAVEFSTYQVTDSAQNNSNIDVAADSEGTPHAVYERNGNIYYKAGIGSEELVGAGNTPSIAVGPDGVPQVVFLNGGNMFFTKKSGANWETPILVTTASDLDIDVDSNNNAHIAFLAKVAPDNYVDIAYIIISSDSLPTPEIIWNGWYELYSGADAGAQYYTSPRIKIDSEGYYHIVGVCHGFSKSMSWVDHDYYVTYKTNAGDGLESRSPWRGNKSFGLVANPLTLDSTGVPQVVYSQSGSTYHAIPGASWVETSLGAFSQFAIDSRGTDIGLAYVSGTDVMYTVNSGEGFDTPVLIDAGSSPAVALGSTFIYYLKSDGTNNEVYLQTDAVMELAPSVTQNPSDVTVTYGENAVFTAEANGSPAPSVQWEYSTDGGENFSDIEEATGTTLTVSIPTVADSGNQYRAVFTNSMGNATSGSATLTVNAAAVSPEVTVDNKVYDGNNDAGILSRSLVGVVEDDDVVLDGGTASFDNKYAGDGKTVTITGLRLSGTDMGNYLLSSTIAAATADITPATLVPQITVDNKMYDGTTTAVIKDRSLSGIIGDDEVTLSGGSAVFADRNAGSDKEVTVTGLVLAGADAGNYALSTDSPITTADITTLEITVSAEADEKTYDGTNASAGIPSITGGLGTGDTAGFYQIFETEHAGTDKRIIPTGQVNDGNGGENYSVNFVDSLGGIITPRELTVTSTADSKVYDGTTVSSGIPFITIGTLADGDTAEFSQAFENKNVGTSKTLTPEGAVDDGNSGLNYNVTYTAASTGTITSRSIEVTAAADSKTYDGTNASAVVPTLTSGTLADGDTAVLSQAFDSEDAGTNKALIPSASVNDNNDGLNYDITLESNDTGVISPAIVTPFVSVLDKTYDGTTSAMINTRSLDGVIDEDDVTLSDGTAVFTDANAGYDKEVTITELSLSGADMGNYLLSSTTAAVTADINKADASVYLDSLSQTYDGDPKLVSAVTNPPGLTVNFTYNSSSTPPTDAGNYTVVGTISDTNYQGAASNTLVIGKADQTISFSPDPFTGIIYGNPDFIISANASSGLKVSFTSSGHCTVENNTVHITGAGECTVTASQSGNNNYNAATDVSHNFMVGKATATIELSGLSHTYDGNPKYVTVNTTPSGVNYVVAYVRESSPVENPVDAGSYTVEVTIDDDNYTGDPASDTLVISKATPEITWTNPADISYGTPLGSTQLNASAEIEGSFEYTPTAGTVLELGDNQRLSTVFIPEDTVNYNNAAAEVTINVTRALPDIAVSSSVNPSMTGQTVAFTADVTSTAGNPTGNVDFKDGDTILGTVPLVDGQAVYTTSTLSAGSHSITVEYAGDSYFRASISSSLIQRVNTLSSSGGGNSGSIFTTMKLSEFSSELNVRVDNNGIAQNSYCLQTKDDAVTISIPKGTRLTDSNGNKLTTFDISIPDVLPAPPSNNILVLGYIFGPSGASFDPALTLTMKYDLSSVPAEVSEKDLKIAYFDGEKWQVLESTVDTQSKTITAKITHFSLYAITGEVASSVVTATPAPVPTQTLTPTAASPTIPTPFPVEQPASTPGAQTVSPSPEPTQPSSLPLIIGIISAIVVIGLVVMVLVRRKAG